MNTIIIFILVGCVWGLIEGILSRRKQNRP